MNNADLFRQLGDIAHAIDSTNRIRANQLAELMPHVAALIKRDEASANCTDSMCACRGGPCAECPDGQKVAEAMMTSSPLQTALARLATESTYASAFMGEHSVVSTNVIEGVIRTLDAALRGQLDPMDEPVTPAEIEQHRAGHAEPRRFIVDDHHGIWERSKCFRSDCQRSAPHHTLYRVNAKGVPGIWACNDHRIEPDTELDGAIAEIEQLGDAGQLASTTYLRSPGD